MLWMSGQWSPVIDWTPTDAFDPDDTVKLAVTAIGTEFTFRINDVLVDTIQESRLKSGYMGVGADATYPNYAVFEYDNFDLIGP